MQAVPGPGQYKTQSQFRPSQSADGTGQDDDEDDDYEDGQNKAPFGSTQQVYMHYMYTSRSQ